jgi:glucoamylase
MQHMTSGPGLEPEQAWEDPDVPASGYGSAPAAASIGFTNGKPAGSASPLIWAQAQYLRLVTDLQTGRLADQPAITADRYVRAKPPAALHVSISAPRPGAAATTAVTAVSGTTAPGATVVVSVAQPGRANPAPVTRTVADAHGHFGARVPTSAGSVVVTAASILGPHATGWAQVASVHG